MGRSATARSVFRRAFFLLLLGIVFLACAGEARAQRSINCGSERGRYRFCPARTHGSARISKQFSSAPCILGQTWGFDDRGVWVDRGCRALFVLGEPSHRPPGGPGHRPPGSGRRRITCSSEGHRRHFCRADTRGFVHLARQLSRAPCQLGRTWGYSSRGVWVDRGCRAEFIVGRPTHRAPMR